MEEIIEAILIQVLVIVGGGGLGMIIGTAASDWRHRHLAREREAQRVQQSLDDIHRELQAIRRVLERSPVGL